MVLEGRNLLLRILQEAGDGELPERMDQIKPEQSWKKQGAEEGQENPQVMAQEEAGIQKNPQEYPCAGPGEAAEDSA